MKLEIYTQSGVLKRIVDTSSSSSLMQELMKEDVVSASWTDTECISLDVNDYVHVVGAKYKIKKEYKPQKKSDQEYSYSVRFYGTIHDAEQVLFLNLTDEQYSSEFSLDDSPRAHLQKWVDNMNRVSGANTWTVGTVIVAPNKNIQYNKVYCWEAGNLMANAFETEIWADGLVINLCRCERGHRVDLGYRQGLTSLTQSENSSRTRFFTRLLPLGSTRNIDPLRYGFKRLQLPSKQKYIDRNTQYGLFEHIEEEAFSGIFPHYTGTVTSVRTQDKIAKGGKPFTVYFFTDEGMDFNPNDTEITGLVKRLTFQSGDLNGREFEAEYHPDAREWEIINIYPDDKIQLPGGHLIPRPGDRYIPWNFRMPQAYEQRAEQEFEAAVTDYLSKYSDDVSIYEGHTDYIYCAEHDVPLQVGQQVRLLSPEYFGAEGYRDTRMTKVVRKLEELHDAAISCTAQVSRGWKSNIESSINKLEYVVTRQQEETRVEVLKSWDDAKEPTNYNVFSSARSLVELDKRLSKHDADTAGGHITFEDGLTSSKVARLLKGLETSDYVGGLAGRGAKIDEDGRAELESLFVRTFIESPDFRYNRVTVVQGEQWNAKGGGIIESANTDEKTIRLKLEPGEQPAVAVDDLCKSTYNTGAGFGTCFFRITSVQADGTMHYELREGYDMHPQAAMHFVAFGNKTDATRQASSYSTTNYTRYLRWVNDWEITVDNIAMQFGDLSNLSIYGLHLEGYSAYLNNVYFTGMVAQISQVVKQELDKVQIGGSNLLPGTSDGREWVLTSGYTEFMGDRTFSAKSAYHGESLYIYSPYIRLEGNETYTLSFLSKCDSNIKECDLHFLHDNFGENGALVSLQYEKTTEWKRLVLTFTTTEGFSGRDVRLRIDHNGSSDGNMAVLYMKDIKLERGSVATDWSEAPEDLTRRISQAKAEATQDAIAGVQVGGRNYFKNTSPVVAWTDTGVEQNTIERVKTGFNFSGNREHLCTVRIGEVITEKGWWTVSFDVQSNGSSHHTFTVDICDTGKQTFNLHETPWTFKHIELSVFVENHSDIYNFVDIGRIDWLYFNVRNLKIEKGNKATSYTEAPEDIESKLASMRSDFDIREEVISTKVQEVTAKAKAADNAALLAMAVSRGKMLYRDPSFEKGWNSVGSYDSFGAQVDLSIVTDAPGNPNASGKAIKLSVLGNSNAGSTWWGGFLFPNHCRANAVYVTRIIARIPVGRNIVYVSGAAGDGAEGYWLTDTAGTGDWKEYSYCLKCGSSGSFFAYCHIVVVGGEVAPFEWYVAYATVFDVTDAEDIEARLKAIKTPEINPSTGNWMVWDDVQGRLVDSGRPSVAPMTSMPAPHDASATYIGNSQFAAVVYDTNGLWYKAIKDVPVGIALSNREYWSPISSAQQIGFMEAYAKALWANQAFIDQLNAATITARMIKAGANLGAPQGFNALIDSNGYGHLSGGALRFDEAGLHMGAFDVSNNRVAIKDENGVERVVYSRGAAESLSDISARGTFSGTITMANDVFSVPMVDEGDYDENRRYFYGTKEYWKSEPLHVPRDGASIRIPYRVKLMTYSHATPSGGNNIIVSLSTDKINEIQSFYINIDDGFGAQGVFTLDGLAKGNYYLKFDSYIGFACPDVIDEVGVTIYYEPITWKVETNNYRRVAYFSDGWYISYPDLLLYQSEAEGFVLKGKTDLPGVLCAARIDHYRKASYAWGKFVNERGKDKPGVAYANGFYTVYHSIGHTNYVPMVTPQNGGGLSVDMVSVNADSFTFKLFNRSGNTVQSAFNYQCFGSNGQ